MLAYQPNFATKAAVYRLQVGNRFYVGSTRRLGSRFSSHRQLLASGDHPNPEIQEAFNSGGSVSLSIIEEVPRKHHDSDQDHKDRLKFREQIHLDTVFGTPGCSNRSSSTRANSCIGEWLKKQWRDPVFREAQIARMKSRRGESVGPETRKKMAQAKTGKANPKSRECVLELNGKKFKFACGAEAAKHFNVSQQVMDLWLRGKVPWPGTGVRAPRQKNLTGLTGKYV